MGHIWFSGQEMYGNLSEIVGVKSGLALDYGEISDFLRKDKRFEEAAECEPDDGIRIASYTFEDIVEYLLYSVGWLEQPNNPPPLVGLIRKYGRDEETMKLIEAIVSSFNALMEKAMKAQIKENIRTGRGEYKPGMPLQLLDPSVFIRRAYERYGRTGLDMAGDLIKWMDIQRQISPWSMPEASQWSDTAELKGLFESESLKTQYGRFFDQRYIDYLHRNFDDISRINWRKFEGLTAEYFVKQGFEVELGPGRDDGGVDVRVWGSKALEGEAPTMIIQCKRHKEKICKMVVKALYADVLHEKAQSGLIVTTASLSPGAGKVCEARNYPIQEAGRHTLKKWISEMRKPGRGVIY